MLMSSSRLSKQTRSKKARSSRALKLSLAAVAGAAGVVADDVSAEVITANLGGTATTTNQIYFSYNSGTISTLASGYQSVVGTVGFGKGQLLSKIVASGNVGGAGLFSDVCGIVAPGSQVGPSTTGWTGQSGVNLLSGSAIYGVRIPTPDSPVFFGQGIYNYGWVEVGYTPTGFTFGQAAIETIVNTPITAGSVPEIDPASAGSAVSLVAGVLAMVEQRRRKRFASAGSLVG
jgi:hypothetical protein